MMCWAHMTCREKKLPGKHRSAQTYVQCNPRAGGKTVLQVEVRAFRPWNLGLIASIWTAPWRIEEDSSFPCQQGVTLKCLPCGRAPGQEAPDSKIGSQMRGNAWEIIQSIAGGRGFVEDLNQCYAFRNQAPQQTMHLRHQAALVGALHLLVRRKHLRRPRILQTHQNSTWDRRFQLRLNLSYLQLLCSS